MAPGLISRLAAGIAIVRKLDDAERKISLPPSLSPGLDHGRQKNAVLLRSILVGFSLIPEGAADCERHKRLDHAVVDGSGDPVSTKSVWLAWSDGGLIPISLCFGRDFAPLLHLFVILGTHARPL